MLTAVKSPDAATRKARLKQRLAAAKQAFSVRRIRIEDATRLVRDAAPKPGDVLLARVVQLGQHQKLEDSSGRRTELYPGDEIIVAYGNRYAPDQFEAFVPSNLNACQLVAAGGIAAEVASQHHRLKPATAIEPIGMLARRDGSVMNLRDYAIATDGPLQRPSAKVLAVLGSSMNAGKTTTAAALVRGLTLAGFRVGAAKLTGTGSGGDIWAMTDSGTMRALDFTDAGQASTFGLEAIDLEAICGALLGRLDASGAEISVVEVADGLFQRETAMVVDIARRHRLFDGVVFAAADAMSAAYGVEWLKQRDLAPHAISGLVSASPLASREAVSVTGTMVATVDQLRDPIWVAQLVFGTVSERTAA